MLTSRTLNQPILYILTAHGQSTGRVEAIRLKQKSRLYTDRQSRVIGFNWLGHPLWPPPVRLSFEPGVQSGKWPRDTPLKPRLHRSGIIDTRAETRENVHSAPETKSRLHIRPSHIFPKFSQPQIDSIIIYHPCITISLIYPYTII